MINKVLFQYFNVTTSVLLCPQITTDSNLWSIMHVVYLCCKQLCETLPNTHINIFRRLSSDRAAGVRTSEPVASRIVGWALSGAQAIHSTTCSCSLNSALHSFEETTQTRTVWSLEQLAINEPSWLGRTILTHSLWPAKVFTQYLHMEIHVQS